MKIYKSEDFIERGRSVGIFRARNSSPEPMHSHDFIELVYIRSGRAIQHIDDESYEVSRGDVLFINRGSVHSFEPLCEMEYINICFSPEVVSDSIITKENAPTLLLLTAYEELRRGRDGGVISFHGEERTEAEGLLDAMLREHGRDEPYAYRIVESYMNVFVMRMLRALERGIADDGLDDMWRQLTEYIDENCSERVSLSELAKRCFYNPSYFSRAFKQRVGVSLTEYVARKRVERASALLTDTDMSVEKICETVGFSDRSAFYRAFVKYMGITVGEYRKR